MTDKISTDRRGLLASGILGAAALAATPANAMAAPGEAFPKGFLWGASTAAHQVEGSTVNSDLWFMETVEPKTFADQVGDACNSYHRWRENIALMKLIGLNSYRFSIEWSRIEPNPGLFSQAEIDHYKGFVAALMEAGFKPVVTFFHVSAPRWFAESGGWLNPESPKLFARFCDRMARELRDGMAYACTINEPQVGLTYRLVPGAEAYFAKQDVLQAAAHANATKKLAVERFVTMNHPDVKGMMPNLIAAHKEGYAAIKSAASKVPTGVTFNLVDFQPANEGSRYKEVRQLAYGAWLQAAKASGDFVGVQTYRQMRIPGSGPALPPPPEMPFVKADNRQEVIKQPAALRNMVEYVHAETGLPIYVTENGIETDNDARREWYIPQVLSELHEAIAGGVPVIGYAHWSLVDNFEWLSGYTPKFGLAVSDPATFIRTLKPSARVYGRIAKANAV